MTLIHIDLIRERDVIVQSDERVLPTDQLDRFYGTYVLGAHGPEVAAWRGNVEHCPKHIALLSCDIEEIMRVISFGVWH